MSAVRLGELQLRLAGLHPLLADRREARRNFPMRAEVYAELIRVENPVGLPGLFRVGSACWLRPILMARKSLWADFLRLENAVRLAGLSAR